MTETVKIISPVDGSVYAERPVAGDAEIDAAISSARNPDSRRYARNCWPISVKRIDIGLPPRPDARVLRANCLNLRIGAGGAAYDQPLLFQPPFNCCDSFR